MSDCRDAYQDEAESCQVVHAEPDEAEDLQVCVQNAAMDYESCAEECAE